MHKEGYPTIAIFTLALLLSGYFFFTTSGLILTLIFLLFLALWLLILYFFRNPNRSLREHHDDRIMAPADGKVVVIEEALDKEYFNEKRLQVSIFMSPLNVHVNRYPISGRVVYAKHFNGKFLPAWNPKSSTENERASTVIENGSMQILVKQIAGALARRICQYAKNGDGVTQGEELGFIKFGSRVDLLLPLGTKLNIKLDQKVLGNRTIIAYLPTKD